MICADFRLDYGRLEVIGGFIYFYFYSLSFPDTSASDWSDH